MLQATLAYTYTFNEYSTRKTILSLITSQDADCKSYVFSLPLSHDNNRILRSHPCLLKQIKVRLLDICVLILIPILTASQLGMNALEIHIGTPEPRNNYDEALDCIIYFGVT